MPSCVVSARPTSQSLSDPEETTPLSIMLETTTNTTELPFVKPSNQPGLLPGKLQSGPEAKRACPLTPSEDDQAPTRSHPLRPMTAKGNCDARIDLLLRLLHPYASGVKRNPVIRSLTAESTNTAAKPALQQMAQDHLTLLPLYASSAKQNPVIQSPTAESTSTAAHPARRQLALS